jgi:hypothetical protein
MTIAARVSTGRWGVRWGTGTFPRKAGQPRGRGRVLATVNKAGEAEGDSRVVAGSNGAPGGMPARELER